MTIHGRSGSSSVSPTGSSVSTGAVGARLDRRSPRGHCRAPGVRASSPRQARPPRRPRRTGRGRRARRPCGATSHTRSTAIHTSVAPSTWRPTSSGGDAGEVLRCSRWRPGRRGRPAARGGAARPAGPASPRWAMRTSDQRSRRGRRSSAMPWTRATVADRRARRRVGPLVAAVRAGCRSRPCRSPARRPRPRAATRRRPRAARWRRTGAARRPSVGLAGPVVQDDARSQTSDHRQGEVAHHRAPGCRSNQHDERRRARSGRRTPADEAERPAHEVAAAGLAAQRAERPRRSTATDTSAGDHPVDELDHGVAVGRRAAARSCRARRSASRAAEARAGQPHGRAGHDDERRASHEGDEDERSGSAAGDEAGAAARRQGRSRPDRRGPDAGRRVPAHGLRWPRSEGQS